MDVFGFLGDEPWHLRIPEVLLLTDRQIATWYNPPRDRQTGARKATAVRKGRWSFKTREESKLEFMALGQALRFSPEQLERAWREAEKKKGVSA